jgi:hypothetical protein
MVLVAGGLFCLIGVGGMVLPGKWERRVLWTLQQVRPELARMQLRVDHWTASTDDRAVVHLGGAGQFWHADLASPGWEVRPLEGAEAAADAYCDTKSGVPAVIEIGEHLLYKTAFPRGVSN